MTVVPLANWCDTMEMIFVEDAAADKTTALLGPSQVQLLKRTINRDLLAPTPYTRRQFTLRECGSD
jgi:hypothetical protein